MKPHEFQGAVEMARYWLRNPALVERELLTVSRALVYAATKLVEEHGYGMDLNRDKEPGMTFLIGAIVGGALGVLAWLVFGPVGLITVFVAIIAALVVLWWKS